MGRHGLPLRGLHTQLQGSQTVLETAGPDTTPSAWPKAEKTSAAAPLSESHCVALLAPLSEAASSSEYVKPKSAKTAASEADGPEGGGGKAGGGGATMWASEAEARRADAAADGSDGGGGDGGGGGGASGVQRWKSATVAARPRRAANESAMRTNGARRGAHQPAWS